MSHRMSQGCLKDVSRMSQGCLKDVSRMSGKTVGMSECRALAPALACARWSRFKNRKLASSASSVAPKASLNLGRYGHTLLCEGMGFYLEGNQHVLF